MFFSDSVVSASKVQKIQCNELRDWQEANIMREVPTTNFIITVISQNGRSRRYSVGLLQNKDPWRLDLTVETVLQRNIKEKKIKPAPV